MRNAVPLREKQEPARPEIVPVWASPQHPLRWVRNLTGELAVRPARRVLGRVRRSRRWGGLDHLGWPDGGLLDG